MSEQTRARVLLIGGSAAALAVALGLLYWTEEHLWDNDALWVEVLNGIGWVLLVTVTSAVAWAFFMWLLAVGWFHVVGFAIIAALGGSMVFVALRMPDIEFGLRIFFIAFGAVFLGLAFWLLVAGVRARRRPDGDGGATRFPDRGTGG